MPLYALWLSPPPSLVEWQRSRGGLHYGCTHTLASSSRLRGDGTCGSPPEGSAIRLHPVGLQSALARKETEGRILDDGSARLHRSRLRLASTGRRVHHRHSLAPRVVHS